MQTKTATQIQAEIDLMRLAYASRRNLNQPRRDRMLGWSLLLAFTGIPALASILYLLTR